jgi:hypothetical protein
MYRFPWKALIGAFAGAILTTSLMVKGADAKASPHAQKAFERDEREEHSHRSPLAAWVELGANGQSIARVITSARFCPFIQLDDSSQEMWLRAGPETAPLRPTNSPPSKPSAFPVRTCEYFIPERTRFARVMDTVLPLPKRHPRRIVILGDTGCRLLIGDPWQACNDPEEWPFHRIAETAARFKPDLVLHVGDYQYRENECPPDIGGCQGSPWGYGWDTWEADLFKPGAKLLEAAPWIMVRGNHEVCKRAGQGWYRFLDTQLYESARTCNDPKNDAEADYNDPFAVRIGDDTQIIVFDSSNVTKSKLLPKDPAFVKYQEELRQVEVLAANNPNGLNIWTNHHPLLAFSPVAGMAPTGGNPALLSVMDATYPRDYYPPGIGLALHGHTHIFEALNFSTNHPAMIMNGNGGDNLDLNLPDPFPTDAHPDAAFESVVDVQEIADTSTFGFMVADREGNGRWTFRAYTRDGRQLTSCRFAGSKIACSKLGFVH